jgi:hypothetical protein
MAPVANISQILALILLVVLRFSSVDSFSSARQTLPIRNDAPILKSFRTIKRFPTSLCATDDDNDVDKPSFTDSESTALGISGLITSAVMLYSESVLFRTGCGLPAGPFGLVGAVEGISYLGTTALVGYSLYTKIKTRECLPSGPGGILGAAEGIAYLAIFAGIWVLVAQVTNYGYIPNAIPTEGGVCM